MKQSAYKISNKITSDTVYVVAGSPEDALQEMAKAQGAARFEDLKDAVTGTPLLRSLFSVSPGYWKSANMRGRFATKESAACACVKKGITPEWLQFWVTNTPS